MSPPCLLFFLSIHHSHLLCLDLSVSHFIHSSIFFSFPPTISVFLFFLYLLYSLSVSLCQPSFSPSLILILFLLCLMPSLPILPPLPLPPCILSLLSPNPFLLYPSLYSIPLTLSFWPHPFLLYLSIPHSSYSLPLSLSLSSPLSLFPSTLTLLAFLSLRPTDVFTPQTTSCCWKSMKACSRPPFRPSSPGELPHFKRKWIILWNEWRHVRRWQTVMDTHTRAS